MKTILWTMGLILAAASANAETITLYTTGGFGALHQYHDVANSSDALDSDGNAIEYSIDLYLPQQGTTANGALYLDGVQYVCPNMPAFPALNVLTSSTCVDTSTGNMVSLVINESHYRKQFNSGRTHMWRTYWTLIAGTLVR